MQARMWLIKTIVNNNLSKEIAFFTFQLNLRRSSIFLKISWKVFILSKNNKTMSFSKGVNFLGTLE